ncbi:MAG: 23S rRNA (adenine(2503)-C(2))-methyltransferase RlmN, partial [Vulcanimicrobiaceae bacterium]
PQDIWFEEKARRGGYACADGLLTSHALKPYRLQQIYRAATKELMPSIDAVSTLQKELREALSGQGFAFDSIAPSVIERSRDGQTTKGLFRLADGSDVEAVLMEHYGDRSTVCISSQAGCAYACAFCATGQAGFTRNLEATEIFDQAVHFARELHSRGKKITNIVFMGMGEPFANYEAVMDAVRLLHDPQGFGLGHRHITISTVGLVPQIDRFADEGIQVNLAISLHAPSDELRAKIMPVNRKYALVELMASVERYVAKTKRKVFFEYVMLRDVNDSDECAHQLAKVMRGPLYHVNLIPYNATPDADFVGSSDARVRDFQKKLEARGVVATVRVPMGRDIAAACGQLSAQTQPKAGLTA